MAVSVTDDRGYFFVHGNESEWSTIDPVLVIHHKCNDGGIVNFFIPFTSSISKTKNLKKKKKAVHQINLDIFNKFIHVILII